MKILLLCFLSTCYCVAAVGETISTNALEREASSCFAGGGTVAAVLFRTTGVHGRIFLNDEERAEFSLILRRLRRRENRVAGKLMPQNDIFVYWTIQEDLDQLDRDRISFNSRRRSVSWVSDDETDTRVKSLISKLLIRLKEDTSIRGVKQ